MQEIEAATHALLSPRCRSPKAGVIHASIINNENRHITAAYVASKIKYQEIEHRHSFNSHNANLHAFAFLRFNTPLISPAENTLVKMGMRNKRARDAMVCQQVLPEAARAAMPYDVITVSNS